MQEVVHADIFFFITSLSVVLITVGILAVLYHLVPIVRDLRSIVAKAKKAGDEIEKDFAAFRAVVHEEGNKGRAIVDLVLGFIMRKLSPSTSRRAKKQQSSSEG